MSIGPPFKRHPATGEHIRGKGDDLAKSAGPVSAVVTAVDTPHRVAVAATDGDVVPALWHPVTPVRTDADRTARGATVAGGAVRLFAGHVDAFNTGVDALNTRWSEAVRDDFGVQQGDRTEAEHTADVAGARGTTAAALRVEYLGLQADLDTGAGDVSKILHAGPDLGQVLLAYYDPDTGGGKPSLADILRTYQVRDDPDGMEHWPPWPMSMFVDQVNVTGTEAHMLNNLGLLALQDMQGMKDNAFNTADSRVPPVDGDPNDDVDAHNDNHNDAYRHAYWNSLMTRRFGEEWTEDYTNAHEGVPGNSQVREAMDLYNNEVGRRIAVENPDATEAEIQGLVKDALDNGELVVVDSNGNLAWSNTVESGQTGDGSAHGDGPEDGNADNDPNQSADPDSHNDEGTGS